MYAPFQTIIDRQAHGIAQRISAELIATRKQAIAYLDDIDPSVSATQRCELLVSQFAYTKDEARRLYNEWLEDVA